MHRAVGERLGDYLRLLPIETQADRRLLQLLRQRVRQVDVGEIREEVALFLRERQSLEVWSQDFFLHLIENIETVDGLSISGDSSSMMLQPDRTHGTVVFKPQSAPSPFGPK